MKKTNLLILLCFFIVNQAFAQQSQSFAEYWFGTKPQTTVPQASTKSAITKTSAKSGLRSTKTDANGIITLDLSSPMNPESFDVNANGVWTGTYNDEDYTFFEANSPFAFSHILDGVGASYGGYYWDGFTYSKNGDNTNHGNGGSMGWISNQWGNMANGGIKTDSEGNVMKDENGVVLTDADAPYLVAYWGFSMEPEYFYTVPYYGVNLTEPAHNLQTLFMDGNTYEAVGMYVNNHPWPYYGNISGDGFARALDQEGDYFKLIIHGLDANWEETGKSVEHILAEYKNGELIQSPNWEWVDLSSLGEIGGLYYTMKTTDEDPTYGPNTAAYFCMDKLQIKAVEKSDVSITMNAVSRTMSLKNKETGETVEIGDPTSYKYEFKAVAGDYILSAYATDGTTLNGTIELTITDEETQTFQFFTITAYATNSGWTLGTDYTLEASVSSREGLTRVITQGSSITSGRITFLTCSGDTYRAVYTPSADRQTEGYLTASASGTITANVTASKAIPMGYTYTVTAPKEATVFVGFPDYSGYYFRPFTEIIPENVTNEDDNKIYTYTIGGSQACIYRISQNEKVTYASVFTKATSDETLTITADMLDGDPKAIDHNVSSNNGYNVSDIYLNINEKGFLNLASGETHQIINIRAWQTNNSITANLFIEPDYHYTVINENGTADASVVTVNEKGLLTAVGNGTAIVLVTYDAINVASALGGPFFSAIWPENTGVFVVSVDGSESGVTPNMTINETRNTGTDKNAGINVDAELDVFYYLESNDSYKYTFTPQGVTSVALAQPIVGTNMTTYNGFENVSDNGDGSYTVELIHGRNIVKMISATGVSYQVLTAKPVTYTVTNTTNEGEIPQPGDAVSVRFNTVYHPNTKLAGIYNMNARIEYEANGATVNGTANQYTFANTANAQTVSATIPAEWNTENDFLFTDGRIRSTSFGDPFGNHRTITLEVGRNPNFTAVMLTGYFGALPDVAIRFSEAPTAPANLKGIPTQTTISLSWDVSIDNVSVAGYNVYVDGEFVKTVATNAYVISELTASTFYFVEIEAFDADDNKSEKVSGTFKTQDILVTGILISQETATLEVEETLQLSATIQPNDATNQNVIWSSSDETIATVDADGLVTALAVGNATITVKTQDGDFTTNCEIEVTTTTNIVEVATIGSISVYPNPFTDYIIINATTNGTAIIYSLSGEAMLNVTIQKGENRINTSALSKGVYVLKTGDSTVKIVK